MKITYNAIETDRAYVRYNNIQHISWSRKDDAILEVKIYTSNNSPIIQNFSKEEYSDFIYKYKEFCKKVNK